jgi:hypothetical protein
MQGGKISAIGTYLSYPSLLSSILLVPARKNSNTCEERSGAICLQEAAT